MEKLTEIIAEIGGAIGYFITVIQRAATQALEMTAKRFLPFLVFISLLIGIINGTGLGNLIANILVPLASSLVGLLALAFICTIPIVSPILAPGAVIAAVLGSLIGAEIGKGTLAPSFALPALYAIDAQVGCDTLPLSLGLLDSSEETMEVGIPAVLVSRWITGIIAVAIAWVGSIGMYQK